MDLQLVKSGFLELARRKRKWVLLCAAFGFSSYGVYRVYRSPSMARKRKRLLKLFGAFMSLAEAVSNSAEAVGVVSKDLKDFIQSDTDKIPNSFKQISKITNSNEFSKSVITLTQALTAGILRGYKFDAKSADDHLEANSSFLDPIMDKLFTSAGSGFASVVVGSFARNLVMGFFLDGESTGGSNSSTSASVDKWVNVVCSDKCREVIGDCIQLFVSTMVAVYLDKTMHINTYEEFFAGMTNPKHEARVKDMLVSVCNGAVETLVKTSHGVLTNANSDSKWCSGASHFDIDQELGGSCEEFDEQEESLKEFQKLNSFHEVKDSGWVSKVSSTLAVPGNKRFVLDMTGRVTFETVRSLLEFFLEKLYDAIKRCIDVVHETVVGSSIGIVRYVTAKSSVLATVCFSLCLHVVDSAWILVPA